MQQKPYVVVIGAANADILGVSGDSIILEDSNPGTIKICCGGVARNIAENVARLGITTKLITALGQDAFAKEIISSCQNAKIDFSHSLSINTKISSTYIAISNSNGEMAVALSDLSILEEITAEFLSTKADVLQNASIIVVDAGINPNTIKYLIENFKTKKIYIDPVSIGKAKNMKNFLSNFEGIDTIKVNKIEAEFLAGTKIHDPKNVQELESCAKKIIEQGIKRVFITLGQHGVFYSDENQQLLKNAQKTTVINATGAGDSFMAGIVYCDLNEKQIRYTLDFASQMSRTTLQCSSTVDPNLSLEKIQKHLN